jgi:DNA-binding MarR family transcriptional regulator
MESQHSTSAVRLGGLLYQAHAVARHAADEALRDLGLELRDLGVLELLRDGESWTQRRLGERLGIDKSAMVRIVDLLERAGLVARRRRGDDRRAYAITITDAGRARMVGAYSRAGEAMDALLVGFSDAERHSLGELLERLVRRAG